jgi:hypothetical protein
MEHYATLFDGNYLPQGLALHSSLLRHGGEFQLWILCVDKKSEQALRALNLKNVQLLPLNQFETQELREVRAHRTIGEYCWTLTPFIFPFVFQANPKIERLTYLDADTWLRKSPAPIFQELETSKKTVLITDHGYAPEYDASATSGQYCVQFLTFYREGPGHLLQEWQMQCLEWCFNRVEEGKFGDQKYLDEWPIKYPQLVHVLQKEHLTLAPWNATRFPYGNSVLWHFHGLRLSKNHESGVQHVNLSENYPLLDVVKKNVYIPYLRDLSNAFSAIDSLRV